MRGLPRATSRRRHGGRVFRPSGGSTIYRARGGDACGGRGLRGRVGIYEVLQVTPPIRTLIARGAPAEQIHEAALAAGMVDLKRAAARLLLEGRTSVEEVMQVVSTRD